MDRQDAYPTAGSRLYASELSIVQASLPLFPPFPLCPSFPKETLSPYLLKAVVFPLGVNYSSVGWASCLPYLHSLPEKGIGFWSF